MREDEVRTVPKVSFHAMQQVPIIVWLGVFGASDVCFFETHFLYLTSVDESSHGFIVVTLQVVGFKITFQTNQMYVPRHATYHFGFIKTCLMDFDR